MPSSAECRTRAAQKLLEAEQDTRRSRKLIGAAKAWLLLASGTAQIERASASLKRRTA